MNKEQQLHTALDMFVENFLTALDCDGCTRFVACMLDNHKIKYDVYEGVILNKETKKGFPIHNWILTKKGVLFDFKTEKWIGCKSDKTTYLRARKLDKETWILPNKMPKSVLLGTLLSYGIEAPLATMVEKNG